MSDYKYEKRLVVNSWIKLVLGIIIVVCSSVVLIGASMGVLEADFWGKYAGLIYGAQFAWGVTLIGISVDIKKKRVPITEMDKLKQKLS